MFDLQKFVVLAVVLVSAAAFNASALDYDIYIASGQSNMDGRGDSGDLAGPLSLPQPGTLIYYANPADPEASGESDINSGWQALGPGFSIPPGTRSAGLLSDAFGPEVSFASAIGPATGTANPIAIIKVSRGGTNLRSDWSPTGFMYTGLLSQVDAALLELNNNGDTGTIRGMIWHQGESDTSRESTYQANLEELIANVRNEFGNDQLGFVIGELAQEKPESFRTLQSVIAASNTGVGFASSAGLNTTDGTHFDAASQVVLGERFAQAMAPLVPEPASGACLLLMAGVLAGRRRR